MMCVGEAETTSPRSFLHPVPQTKQLQQPKGSSMEAPKESAAQSTGKSIHKPKVGSRNGGQTLLKSQSLCNQESPKTLSTEDSQSFADQLFGGVDKAHLCFIKHMTPALSQHHTSSDPHSNPGIWWLMHFHQLSLSDSPTAKPGHVPISSSPPMCSCEHAFLSSNISLSQWRKIKNAPPGKRLYGKCQSPFMMSPIWATCEM